MRKFETEFSVDELYRLAYDWNGFIFDAVLKYCAKCRMFTDATNIGDVQTHIKEQIKERTGDDTEISRDTFNRWRKDGSKGPKNLETILLLDTLISDVHFLHRPCDKENKELLHQLYVFAWSFHYKLPLAMEGDEFLYLYIQDLKQEYFHENLYENMKEREKYKGAEFDSAIKDSQEEMYMCALLDDFYSEYHGILTEDKITNFHAVEYRGDTVLTVEYEDKLYFVAWDIFLQQFKDTLRKRVVCLEKFGDRLRKLFLGGDMNA